MKPKALQQTYRVKKLKPVDRPVYNTSNQNGSGTFISQNNQATVEEQQRLDTTKQETLATIDSLSLQRYEEQTIVHVPSLPPNETKATDENKDIYRSVEISKISSTPIQLEYVPLSNTIRYSFDTVAQVLLNGKVYDIDKDIHFYAILQFVPNYDIVLYKQDLDDKLGELVQLLKEYPQKTVHVYGHGGMESPEEQPHLDKQWNPHTLEFEDFYYGNSTEVYEQTVYELANEDPYHQQRIKEEKRFLVSEAVVGDLLLSRAIRIKKYLIEQGINKSRISVRRGSFLPHPNHIVEITVE